VPGVASQAPGGEQSEWSTRARNLNYDGTIQQGASQSLGFLGAWTSNDAAPAAFRVNRALCASGSGGV